MSGTATTLKLLLVVAVAALALGAGSQVARAQVSDVYTVDYFANANTAGAPDATVRVINPGSPRMFTCAGPIGEPSLCALIYVFDANQEMSECCGCLVSANAELTLSVNKNLTSNPLLGTPLNTGVIKIVSGIPASFACDPTGEIVFATLRAWATHIQNKVGAAFPITEGESQAAVLGQGERTDLFEDCTVLQELGSSAGVCKCPAGH